MSQCILFFNKNSLTSNWVRRCLDVAFCFFFLVEHLLCFSGHMVFQLVGRLWLKFLFGVMHFHLNWGGACYGKQNHNLCICICMQNNNVVILWKIDHYSFLQWYAFFHRFPTFYINQLQSNMTVYPSILVFLFDTCPMLDFNSPRATVKMLFYAFSKSFPCCKFSYISLAICHKIGATWEPWIYQLGTLKLIHVWPGNWIVATDWVTSLDRPFISPKVFCFI